MPKPFQITASHEGKKGTIRIVDMIMQYGESSSGNIRNLVDSLIDSGVNEVEVYLNTRGGSVFEANEIVNELKRIPKVVLQVGALAASAGTYFLTKFPSRAYPNSHFMIHRPRFSVTGDLKKIESELKGLRNVTEDYIDAYAAKMSKTAEQIEEMWQNGDYWMSAKEALKEGLIDELVEEPVALTDSDIDTLVALGCPQAPPKKEKSKPKFNNKMENRNQIIAVLKLPADATDADIEAAVKKAQAAADELATLKATAEKTMQAEASRIVDDAILKKKITADVRDNYIAMAVSDLENTKAVLDALPVPVKGSAQMEGNPNASADGREKWTLEDWQAKDPKGLSAMAEKEPEKFQALNDAYFATL